MPRHDFWDDRRRGAPEALQPGPISGDPARSDQVALTVFFDGNSIAWRRRIARYQAASAGRSRLIAWCDAAAAPWALKRWNVALENAPQRLHTVDADGRLLTGAAALGQLWRELPGYRLMGLLLVLPGIAAVADGIDRLRSSERLPASALPTS